MGVYDEHGQTLNSGDVFDGEIRNLCGKYLTVRMLMGKCKVKRDLFLLWKQDTVF